MAAIEIKTVQTDGFEMEYFCFGHGKEPLVILPGLSVQSVMGAADAVADAYRLLRFLVSQSSEKTICRSTAGCKRKSKHL